MQFVKRWRPVNLIRLGIPHRTVYDWRAGTNEPPKGWQREAAELLIRSKAGPPESPETKAKGKSGKPGVKS
jgi:hypothetical protein